MEGSPVMQVAWDLETALIRPGKAAPELVCMTYSINGEEPKICLAEEASDLMRAWLSNSDVLIFGHNVGFDELVLSEYRSELLPLFFKAHEQDRVTDTMLRERLITIANGQAKMFYANGKWNKTRYDLGSVSAKYLGGTGVNKEDPWRLRYADLLGVPLERWPHEAKGYALEDARATWRVYAAQEKAAPDPVLRDQFRQAFHAFALALVSAWACAPMKTLSSSCGRGSWSVRRSF